jgi:hypothetical protein
VIVFNPKLWLWNSNVYTLDFIITESWYKAGGVGAETPLPFSLSYVPCPPSKRPSLEYAFFGLIGDPETFTLPVQPPNWYSPPPLP